MPPRPRFRAGAKSTATNGSSATTSAASASGPTPDMCHNTDHPCCQPLTDLARQMFPSLSANTDVSTSPSASTASTISTPIAASRDASASLAALLRLHLLHKRHLTRQQHHCLDSSTKKKRKKKKKKKSSDVDGEDEESQHEATTAQTALTPAVAGETMPNPTLPSVAASEASIREHQRRLFRRLVDRFLEDQVDSSSSSSPSVNGSAEPDLSLLHDFVATLNVSTPSSTASTKKNQATSDDRNPLFIPLASINLAMRNIQCMACFKDVERVLCPPTTVPSYSRRLWLKGVQVSSRFDSYVTDEEAQTTHYQLLMEEGLEPPERAQYWSWTLITTTNAVGTKAPLGWELQRPKMSTPPSWTHNDTETATTDAAWSLTDVEFLLEHYAVCMGLPPDVVTPDTSAVTSWAQIPMKVSEQTNQAAQKFNDLAQSIHEELSNLPPRDKFTVTDIHWDAFPDLEKTNATCDMVLDRMLRFVWDVTRSVHTVVVYANYRNECWKRAQVNAATVKGGTGASEESSGLAATVRDDVVTDETHWAVAQCQILWRYFFDDIFRVLSSVDGYYETLMKLAESGEKTDLFVSPMARGAFYDMVQTKLKVAYFFLQKIEAQTQFGTPIGPWSNPDCTSATATFVSRLWTEELFVEEGAGVTTASDHERIDEAWKNVLFGLREMTVIDQHRRSKETLASGQRQQRDKLSRLLTAMLGSMDELLTHPLDEHASHGHWHGLSCLRQEVQRAMESRPDSDFDELSPSDQLKAMRTWNATLLPTLQKATNQWAGGLQRSSGDSCQVVIPPTLPYLLRRSMIPGSWVFGGIFDDHEPCTGGDGHVRASCILVSLLFQSLSERFQEWQAQRAAQELLTTMLDDDMAVVKGKKHKKKAPKKALSNSERNPSVSDPRDEERANVTPMPDKRTASGEEVVALDEVSTSDRMNGHDPLVSVAVNVGPNDVTPVDGPEPHEPPLDPSDVTPVDDPEPTGPPLDPVNGKEPHTNGCSNVPVTAHMSNECGTSDATVPLDDAHRIGDSAVVALDASGVYDERSGRVQDAHAFLVGRFVDAVRAGAVLVRE